MKSVWVPPNRRVLCDCTGHMFTKMALLEFYIAGEKVIAESMYITVLMKTA